MSRPLPLDTCLRPVAIAPPASVRAVRGQAPTHKPKARASLWAGLYCLAALGTSSTARAQTITLTETRINQADEARRVPLRRTGRRPFWISYRDCMEDRMLSFPLRLSNPGSALEIWAGTDDCATNRNLGPTARGQCWLVYRQTSSLREVTALVPARTVVARDIESGDPPIDLDASVCNPEDRDLQGEQLSFYIMQVRGGQPIASVVWTGGTEGTGVDLVGPSPPGSLTLGVGENQLSVRINQISEDADRQRFRVFCVPATRTESTVGPVAPDAAAPDGSVDGGVEQSPSESSGNVPSVGCVGDVPMVQGSLPPLDEQYQCGEAAEFQNRLNTPANLKNGQLYAVGVAGEDVLGNQGPLSSISCATPTALRDFFEVYSDDSGGPGGGGFCTFQVPDQTNSGQTARGVGVALLASLLTAMRLRRVRTNRQSNSEKNKS